MADEAKLFDAVAGVLARQPGSSMREVAAAAGVSRTTLHRVFGDRAALVERVSSHVLADCELLFDEAGLDGAPVLEAFGSLIAAPLRLGKAYALLLAEPEAYRNSELVEKIKSQDDRFERFFARGQVDGVFRRDLPSRWLVYSVGSQVTALWWAVDDGFLAPRDAGRLLRATVLEGIATRGAGARSEDVARP